MTTKKRLPDACDQVQRWDWPDISDMPAKDITLRDLLMWDRARAERRKRREKWLRAFGAGMIIATLALALLLAAGIAGLVAGG